MIIPAKHFGSEVPTLIIRHRFTIVKTNDDAVVPELLDQIFGYLECVDLHSRKQTIPRSRDMVPSPRPLILFVSEKSREQTD